MKTRRSLSSKEAQLILQFEWDKKRFVILDDIVSILKCSKGYARKIVHILRAKGWLETIEPGKYFLILAERGIRPVVPDMNPYIVVKILDEPYYFSYRAACLYYGLTTQVPSVVHVALLRQKARLKLKNMEFRFVKLARHKFFGWKRVKLFGEEVNMADLEKTILDSLEHPDLAGGIEGVVRAIFKAKDKLHYQKLKKYLGEMKSSTLSRRLGLILESLNIPVPEKLEKFLLKQVKKDKAYLASPGRWGKKGKLNTKWNLVENVSRRDLLSEIEAG